MRTTITLEDDVAAKLRAEVRKRKNATFKETVNEVLRMGLLVRREVVAAPKFTVRARSLGTRPGVNYDNIGELLEQMEGPAHK
jgi:hypothetical protein